VNNRVRRTLLSLATVGFALIASSMGATAGGGPGGGSCGFCESEGPGFVCEGQQGLETECLRLCGVQHVAECWEESPNCYNGTSFDIWIECGFLD